MGYEGYQGGEICGCDGVVGAPFDPSLHWVDASAVHTQKEVPSSEGEEANGDGGAIERDEIGLEDDVKQGVDMDIVVQVPNCVLFPQHFYLKLKEDQHHKRREVDKDNCQGIHTLKAGIGSISDLNKAESREIDKRDDKVFSQLGEKAEQFRAESEDRSEHKVKNGQHSDHKSKD